MQRRDFVSLLGGFVLLPGCAALAPAPGDNAAYFDLRTAERLGWRGFRKRLAAAPILLLGEIHDNAAHHRIRAALLLDWVRRKPSRPAAVVFEQLDREYNEALRLAQREQRTAHGHGRGGRGTAGEERLALERLLDAAHFDRRAWGWPAHLPVFEAAQASGATWIAANFSRASAQGLTRDRGTPVDPALHAMVESARWSDEAQASLTQALMQGHCNALSDQALVNVARAQRLRDAALALPLLDANERRTVLIAGNGHVRRDHGVPRYLGAYEYEALAVGFEEDTAAVGPAAAGSLADRVGAARSGELATAYDLLCLTPAARDRGDPCAAFEADAPKRAGTVPAAAPVSPAAPTQTPSR